MATVTDKKFVFKKDVNPFILTTNSMETEYLLGIINSRLISYLYVNTSSIALKDDFRQTTLTELRELPVPNLSKGDKTHDDIVKDVRSIITLKEKVALDKNNEQNPAIERQIVSLEKKIDEQIYRLYRLTNKEIATIAEYYE